MYRHFMIMSILLVGITSFSSAQQSAILGRWLTSDKDVIEFYPTGTTYGAKQTSAQLEKDKKYNGLVVARELKQINPLEFDGTVIDPTDNKTYNGRFLIAPDGQYVELKIKWGFLTHSETWTRIK